MLSTVLCLALLANVARGSSVAATRDDESALIAALQDTSISSSRPAFTIPSSSAFTFSFPVPGGGGGGGPPEKAAYETPDTSVSHSSTSTLLSALSHSPKKPGSKDRRLRFSKDNTFRIFTNSPDVSGGGDMPDPSVDMDSVLGNSAEFITLKIPRGVRLVPSLAASSGSKGGATPSLSVAVQEIVDDLWDHRSYIEWPYLVDAEVVPLHPQYLHQMKWSGVHFHMLYAESDDRPAELQTLRGPEFDDWATVRFVERSDTVTVAALGRNTLAKQGIYLRKFPYPVDLDGEATLHRRLQRVLGAFGFRASASAPAGPSSTKRLHGELKRLRLASAHSGLGLRTPTREMRRETARLWTEIAQTAAQVTWEVQNMRDLLIAGSTVHAGLELIYSSDCVVIVGDEDYRVKGDLDAFTLLGLLNARRLIVPSISFETDEALVGFMRKVFAWLADGGTGGDAECAAALDKASIEHGLGKQEDLDGKGNDEWRLRHFPHRQTQQRWRGVSFYSRDDTCYGPHGSVLPVMFDNGVAEKTAAGKTRKTLVQFGLDTPTLSAVRRIRGTE